MTTATEPQAAEPQAEQPTIPTTSIDVPEVGPVDEERAAHLNAGQLRATLKALGIPTASSTRKPQLLEWTINGLRLRAMAMAGAPVAALEPPPPALHDATVDLEPRPASVIPEVARWEQLVQMGQFLARSNLCPAALRGHPEDVTVVLLGAVDLGIPVTQALNKLVVMDGKLTMMAELMVALALRDGHTILPDPSNDATQATAHFERADNGSRGSVTYTIDEAVAAGLCRFDDEGRVRARSGNGKVLPWEKHTPDMLWARCVARLCRRVFPDCLAGVSYTPEELGWIEAEDAEPGRKMGRAGEPEPTITLHAQQSEIARRVAELPDELRKELAVEWKRRNLPRAADLRPAAIRTVLGLLEPLEERAAEAERAATADVPEAEVVHDGTADGTEAPGAGREQAQEPPGAGEATDGAPEPQRAPQGSDEPVEAEQLMCTAGDGPIGPDEPPAWDDNDRPYHLSCLPF